MRRSFGDRGQSVSPSLREIRQSSNRQSVGWLADFWVKTEQKLTQKINGLRGENGRIFRLLLFLGRSCISIQEIYLKDIKNGLPIVEISPFYVCRLQGHTLVGRGPGLNFSKPKILLKEKNPKIKANLVGKRSQISLSVNKNCRPERSIDGVVNQRNEKDDEAKKETKGESMPTAAAENT